MRCRFTFLNVCVTVTLILLTCRIWWAPNNASKWQMGFNLAFRGLNIKHYNPSTSTINIFKSMRCNSGRDTIVGIGTRYGLGGPEIKSRRGDDIFRSRQYRPSSPHILLCNGYDVIPGGKSDGTWLLANIPIWWRGWRKSRAITVPRRDFMVCS